MRTEIDLIDIEEWERRRYMNKPETQHVQPHIWVECSAAEMRNYKRRKIFDTISVATFLVGFMLVWIAASVTDYYTEVGAVEPVYATGLLVISALCFVPATLRCFLEFVENYNRHTN